MRGDGCAVDEKKAKEQILVASSAARLYLVSLDKIVGKPSRFRLRRANINDRNEMRKTLFAVIMLMISAGQANAAWTDDFLQDYSKFGIDRAVDNALAKAKKTPADILQFILTQNDALKTKITMKALYCSGVDKDIMRQATEQLSIEAEEREVALAESTEECGSLLTLSDRDILDVPSSNNGIGRRQQQPKPPKQPSVRGGREEGAAPSISVPPPTIPSLSSPNQTK